MTLRAFEAADLAALLAQGGQAFAGSRAVLEQPGYGELLRESGQAWTLQQGDRILGVGGISREHAQLGTAWTLLNPIESGRHMVIIDRVARRLLQACPLRRVQATCDPEFEAARRWLGDMLGFKFEGRLAKYTPDGRDQLLFARVI